MGHRGISARAPDFDASKLQGASSRVGFLGINHSGVGMAIVIVMVIGLVYFTLLR